MAHHYWIGLGANLGEPIRQIGTAVGRLGEAGAILRTSRVYETPPLGGPKQDNYLNGALLLQSELTPAGLLGYCQAIEAELGRERTIHWGPRTIDLDILLIGVRGEMVVQDARLQVPHPHLWQRAFALQPLVDIDRSLVHPTLGKALIELLQAAKQNGQVLIERGALTTL